MGRVEKRMYKRRRKRRVRVAAAAAVGLLALGGGMLTRGSSFTGEAIGLPTATPRAEARAVETREVTLAADAWYAIQTGVYSTQEAARERAEAFTARGAPGTVVQDGTKWRVFIACYGNEADAAAVRTRLGDRQQVETYLYTWHCPELRLRLTGQAAQLDLVEAGFALLHGNASALRDAAMLLDAGQLTTEEAAAQAAQLSSQAALWADTARNSFGGRVPEMVKALLAMADGFAARGKAISAAAGSATNLSAALKSQGMGLYDEVVRWRQDMAQ